MSGEQHERGLVCLFCGEGFGYAGQEPSEEILRTAVEHEAKCLNNPYKARIIQLESENARLRGIIERAKTRIVTVTWEPYDMSTILDILNEADK
jgi:hypothetical protein